MDKINVLVVDDSALMRNLISRIVNASDHMQVVGKAMNGSHALDKIKEVNPDIIVLDIEMPVMTGIEFLKERKKLGIDIPVIILSSIAREGAKVTMECLSLGASDFLTKPNGSESDNISSIAERLTELLISYGSRSVRNRTKKTSSGLFAMAERHTVSAPTPAATTKAALTATPMTTPTATEKTNQPFASFDSPAKKAGTVQITPLREPGKIEIIAIGISTGGPNALREVFSKINPKIQQPILVVQHMPAGFTEEFANSLNNVCPIEVKEAKDGDVLKKGRILIAQGNKHLIVEQRSLASVVRLTDDDLRNGHRPSVDALFESIAKIYQNKALGVIMTGMGRDGALQLAEMRRQGARTLGQDEASSVVYGMPKAAYELGGVQKQVSLQDMAEAISSLAIEFA